MIKLQTIIFLVRHGQTDRVYIANQQLDNVRRLNEEGRGQIKKVGEYLKSFAPSAILTSPLHRTVETAQIIKDVAEIPGEITENRILLEEYSAADFAEDEKTVPELLLKLARQYVGEHIVCVSHMDVIEQALRGLGVSSEEAKFPCQMAAVYRLVFAGDAFVECIKVNPANT